MKRPLIFLSILLAAWPLIVQATTVVPVSVKCPLCNKSLVYVAIGSYTLFGDSRARDLSDDLRCVTVVTCPYCLYSALNSEFDTLSPVELLGIKAGFPSLKTALQEAVKHYDLKFDDTQRSLGLAKIVLARTCYAHRKSDPARDLLLLRLAYGATLHEPNSSRHHTCRQELIQWLSKPPVEYSLTGEEAALHTYLLGELLRLAGDDKQALENYAKARQLAASTGNRDITKLINIFCDEQSNLIATQGQDGEQSYRIAAQTMTVQELESVIDVVLPEDYYRKGVPHQIGVAIDTLANRKETEAWAALLRFCQKSDNNLFYLDRRVELTEKKLKAYPPIYAWLKQYCQDCAQRVIHSEPGQYDERAGGVVKRWYIIFDPPERTLMQLRDDELIEKAVEFISGIPDSEEAQLPSNKPLEGILRMLGSLINQDNEKACRLFVSWAKKIKASEDNEQYIKECLDGLIKSPAFWPLALQITDDNNTTDRSVLIECIRFVCNDKRMNYRLIQKFTSIAKWNWECDLILYSFARKKNDGIKYVLFDKWLKPPFSQRWLQVAYLSDVATVEDLSILEKILLSMQTEKYAEADPVSLLFSQEQLEPAVIRLRIQSLISEKPTSRSVNEHQKP